VLIVSPRFPPKNGADLHRVRTSLQYYRQFGWNPTVLCLTPESCDGIDDEMLAESLPKDVEIIRVAAWKEDNCRRFGFGHADYRSWAPLFRAGKQLLKRDHHEVVFFSTTVFPVFLMGPIWKRQFNCKVVYDFQDPWYVHGPSPYTPQNVPGSWWKYRLGQRMACVFEKHALKAADHIVSVSHGYVRDLSTRYPWLGSEKFTVLPFGFAPQDFDFVRQRGVEHGLFARNSNLVRWVYAGRGGPDMDAALAVLFRHLGELKEKEPRLAARLRIHFVGTNYSPSQRTYKVIEPLAARYGIEDLVEEHEQRIPYHQTVSLYSDCDAILLIGSASADYTASKFFNCVAAKKPVLALFHRRSLVTSLAERFPNVALASFDPDPSDPNFALAVKRGVEWLRNSNFEDSSVDRELKPWSAEALTLQQCKIFSQVTQNR
jgi:hypothetical protein